MHAESAAKVDYWLIRAAGQIESDKDQIVLIASSMSNGIRLRKITIPLVKFPFWPRAVIVLVVNWQLALPNWNNL